MKIDELNDEALATAARELVAIYAGYKAECERLSAAVEAFKAWTEGKGRRPARKMWPDYVLSPKLNGVSERLDDEGRCLKSFKPGELPEEVLARGEEYLEAEEELVAEVEELVRDESLLETRTCDRDLWSYVTRRMGIVRFERRLHEAKVDEKIRRKKECYYANCRVIYNAITEKMKGGAVKRLAKEERVMERIEKKLDVVVSEEPVHCWDTLRSRVRRAQVKSVWQLVKGMRAQGEEVELHAVCAKAYRRLKMAEMEGGYPNFHALYKFCREHETEF